MFEAERALSRAIVYDQALTAEDRPRIRETKKVLVEGGGLLEFVPAPEGLDQVGGLEKLKKWIATRKVGFLPDGRRKAAGSAARHPAARRSGLRQEPRRQVHRGELGSPASVPRRRQASRALHRRVRAQPARRAQTRRAHGPVRPLDRRDREGLRLGPQLRVRRRRLQAPRRDAADLDAGAGRARLPRGHGQLGRRAAAGDDAQGPRRRGLLRGSSRQARPGQRSSSSTSRAAARTPRASTRTPSPTPPRDSPAPRSSRRSSRLSTRRAPAASPSTAPPSSPPCARRGRSRSCAPRRSTPCGSGPRDGASRRTEPAPPSSAQISRPRAGRAPTPVTPNNIVLRYIWTA